MISQVQTNSGIFSSVMPGARMFMIVTMTLIEPMIDEAPIRWIAKIVNGKRVAGLQRQRRVQRPAAGRAAAGHEQRRASAA